METVCFHKDVKLTAANILSALHCALQAIATALAAFTLSSVMEVSTETCKNSFSTHESIWLRAPQSMLSEGPPHLASLWPSNTR